MAGSKADLFFQRLCYYFGILAIAYQSWIVHGLVGLSGLVLVVIAVSAGAMLTGRIQKDQINPFLIHKRAGLFLFSLLLGTFLYGLWNKMLHGEPLLRSCTAGWA